MNRPLYGEHDYAFGQQILTLRTQIGLTQTGLAELLHISRRAVTNWPFTPDNRTLLSGSEDGTLRLWEVLSGQCAHVIQGYALALNDLTWSPDGTKLASAGSDSLVTIAASKICLIAENDQIKRGE